MESYLKVLVSKQKEVGISDVNHYTWNGIIVSFDEIGIVFRSTEGEIILFPFTGIANIQTED